MKKTFILVIGFVLALSNFVFADSSVSVGARVGQINQEVEITYINPSNDPILIRNGSLQLFSFGIQDPENQTVYYTISSDHGVISPMGGSVNGSGDINFVYLAPSTAVGFTKIYITLNDTVNLSVKEVNVYVY